MAPLGWSWEESNSHGPRLSGWGIDARTKRIYAIRSMNMRTVKLVNDTAKLQMLLEYLFEPSRRITAIVMTTRSHGMGPVAPSIQTQEAVTKTAQVFLLSPQLLDEYNHELKNVFGIVRAGMRFYKPGMRLEDHHLKHPVWSEARIEELTRRKLFWQELVKLASLQKRYEDGRDLQREEPVIPAPQIIARERRPILRLSAT